MNDLCRNATGLLTALALVSGALVASAEISSLDHPVINRTLKTYPESDTNKDGLLSYAEYRAFVDKPGARTQADGRPAGPISTVLPNGDMRIADFEENNFGRMREWGWIIEGEVFNRDLAAGTRIMKRRVGAYHGNLLLTTLVVSDADVGQILSPIFDVELKFVEVVMSGGEHPQRVCVNLLVDDEVVRTATGRNDDLFEAVAFDVSDFRGRQARVQIVDAHRGVWGHINVDRICQTDQPRAKRVIAETPQNYGKPIGLVQTLDGKQSRGPLSASDGKLSFNGEHVELDSLLLAVCEHHDVDRMESGAVRLISGETWQAKINGLAKDMISIESPLFGQREVPVSQIASLEFIAGPAGAGKPGTLYRTEGEPIPGKLVWIREKDIAIDCPLGIVPIPRQVVRRFVLAPTDASEERVSDEIGLTDGSLLRGRLAVENDKLALTHPTLGSLSFGWDSIRHVQRTPDGVSWFDRLQPSTVERVGPVLPPPAPSVVETADQDCLKAVRMLPRTVARYRLPDTSGSRREFRAQLAPLTGSRAAVIVRILAGERVVFEQQISAASDPISVVADLSEAKEMAIEVDFDGPLAFPCGVDWQDAYLLHR